MKSECESAKVKGPHLERDCAEQLTYKHLLKISVLPFYNTLKLFGCKGLLEISGWLEMIRE
jgi:hypothetical protein